MLFKLSNLNSNLALTLGYLNPALKNWAQEVSIGKPNYAIHSREIYSVDSIIHLSNNSAQ